MSRPYPWLPIHECDPVPLFGSQDVAWAFRIAARRRSWPKRLFDWATSLRGALVSTVVYTIGAIAIVRWLW